MKIMPCQSLFLCQRLPNSSYNGEGFHYKIQTEQILGNGTRLLRDENRTLNANRFSYDFEMSEEQSVEISVLAVNNEGEAPQSTKQSIYIPGRKEGKTKADVSLSW